MSAVARRHRLELVAAGAQLAEAGLILPGEGNVSVRLAGDRCLITPAGADKGRVRAVDLVVVELSGAPAPPGASLEAALHRSVYRRLSAVRAIVHAHPRSVQVLAHSGRMPDLALLLEAPPVLGGVSWVAALPPGSEELAQAVADAAVLNPACVLDRHGAVTVGESVTQAVRRMLLLERLAQLTWEATR